MRATRAATSPPWGCLPPRGRFLLNFRAKVVLCLSLPFLGCVADAASGADEPTPAHTVAPKDEAPVYIFVEKPADLDALRKRLARPDFVILNGAIYDALKSASKPFASPRRTVIESVSMGGEVHDDLARLTFDLGIHLTGDEPEWVPIRLDSQIVSSAREGDRDLPVRTVQAGGHEVQVRGNGTHRVQVAVSAVVLPAKGAGDGRRLEVRIPEAASTRVQIVLAANAAEVASVGPGGTREPLGLEPIEGAQRARASGFLTPRKSVEIGWRIKPNTGAEGASLVTAQGEISIDVERGSLLARSSWEIRSEQGSLRRLDLRVDPADELVGLELNGRPVAEDPHRDRSSGVIAVPLPEAIGPGGSCRMVVTTRRVFSAEGPTRVTYRGLPMASVVAQTGFLAISQRGADPWVTAVPGRGLGAIDPRTELPAGLRARPSIVLAYRFAEQPFDLAIQIDPSPPASRAEMRATVVVDKTRAKLDANLEYTVSRGRIFEVQVALPPGLTVDSVGPPSAVAAHEVLAEGRGAPRRLVARLTPEASENGKFTMRIGGEQSIEPGPNVEIGMPRPIESQSRGGLIAVIASPGVSVDLSEPSSTFVPAPAEPPSSWSWPMEVGPSAIRPALWLRHDDATTSLSLSIRLRDRVVREETTLQARIDRRRLDVDQSTTLQVQFGGIARLDVLVPVEVERAWQVDGLDVLRREPIGPAESGFVPYRLTLARELTDAHQVRFRMGLAFAPSLIPDVPRRLEVPRIRMIGAESASPSVVRVAAVAGIDLIGDGTGWTVPDDSGPAIESGPPVRLERSAGGPIVVVAKAHPILALPKVVASSLELLSAREADGSLRTSATYRVVLHDGSLVVSIPSGATWVKARVGTEAVVEVERASGSPGTYRFNLPSDGGPVSVTLEYLQPLATLSTGAWEGPKLASGGVVEETTWEVRIPSHLTLAGVPRGWTEQNEWVWDRSWFVRRPAGSRTEPRKDGMRAYRFGRVGEPADLSPYIISTSGLIGIISGIVLAFGLLALTARSWSRAATVLATLTILALAVATPPSVVPLVLQASTLGFVLIAVAAFTQLVVDRRPSSRSSLPASLSSLRPVVDAGSEEPTVIRNRAGTTVEHSPEAAPVASSG